MNGNRFCEGQALQWICPSGYAGPVCDPVIRAGMEPAHAIRITVVMENGQMREGDVPWALVEWRNGKREKYNLALCQSVGL